MLDPATIDEDDVDLYLNIENTVALSGTWYVIVKFPNSFGFN